MISSAQTLQWVERAGGTDSNPPFPDDDQVTCVQADKLGNVYVCGEIYPGMTNVAGQYVTSNGESDIFLAKLDCNANLLWVRTAGGPFDDTATGLALDSIGNIYLAGVLHAGPFDKWNFFDTIIGDSEIVSWYCAKFDTSGNYLWGKMSSQNLGHPSNAYCGVQIDKNNNPVIALSANGSYILPGIYLNSGLYMLSLDANGNFNKAVRINGNGSRLGFAQWVMDDEGSFYGTGRYSGDSIVINGFTYYRPRYGLGNNQMFYLYKCDSAGNFQYYYQLTDTISSQMTTSSGGSLLLANDKSIYVGGTAFPGMEIGNLIFTIPPNWNKEIRFFSKFDANGQPLWTKTFPSRYGGSGYKCNMVYRPDGTIAFSHAYVGKTLIGPDTIVNPTGSLGDIVLTTLDTTGNILYYETLTGNNYKFVTTLSSDPYDNIYMGGYFENRIDVNGVPLFSTGGATDGFIARFGGACITSVVENAGKVSLNIYPNPASEIVYVSWPDDFNPEQYEVSNLTGQVILTGKCGRSDHLQELSVSALESGLYFIRIQNMNGKSAVGRLIVE